MNYIELNDRLDFLHERISNDRVELETLIAEKNKRERNEARVKEQMEIGQPLKPIMDMSYDEQFEYLKLLGEIHGIKNVIYSVGDNLDVIAFKGKKTITRSDWDDETYSVELDSPNWLEVWKASDKMISVVNDYHHIFFEGLYVNGDNMVFSMGS